MTRRALLVVLTLASLARADVLVLKDGQRIEGDVKKGEKGYVITKAGGDYEVFPTDQVKSIELRTTSAATPDKLKENLASLRRSVEHDEDIYSIINRFQRFVANNPNTEVGEQAKQDQAVWEQRRDAGLVKYGPRWVTEAERAELQEKTLQVAMSAARHLKAGRLAEAESTINQVLTDDPKNPTGLYLKGLLQYRNEQIIPARKSFEQVNAMVPNHAPTLTNLAVIHARQNQPTQSMNMIDAAMSSSPRNQQVLDNAAELLNAVPDEQRGTQVVQKVARKFTDQDMELQRELASQDLHRWGSTWVNTKQMDELKVAERAAKDRLDALSAEFDAVKTRLNGIDRDIEENDRAMRRLEANSYTRDFQGQIYQSTLPSTYYQLQDDNTKLQREREEQYGKLERIRREAKAVNNDLPIPKYTGVLRMIDVEGAPTVAPKSPATQPSPAAATQPVS